MTGGSAGFGFDSEVVAFAVVDRATAAPLAGIRLPEFGYPHPVVGTDFNRREVERRHALLAGP